MNEEIYEALCAGCPNEKRCHEEAELCDKVFAVIMKEEELEK